jgi:hypothetical protein
MNLIKIKARKIPQRNFMSFTIPISIQKRLKIQPGEYFVVTETDNQIVYTRFKIGDEH